MAIDEEWAAVADRIETAEIRLKKTNVSVQMLSLVWIPV